MAEFEESLEELKGKQKLYEEQLQQVEEALKQEETEDLKRLQADLKEVIQLTRHLVEYKQQQEQQLAEAPAEAAAAAAAAAVAAAAATQEPSPQGAQPSPASAQQEQQQQQQQQQQTAGRPDAAPTPAPAAAAAAAKAAAAEQPAARGPLVGRTCSAEYEGKRYYASIVEVKRDPKEGERVVVDFIGWGNREEYPLQQVVLLPQASAADFPVGAAAQAIYSGDGRWYNCSILAATPFGFRVRFAEYKNEEDLPGDRIRFPRKNTPKNRPNDIITPGGYRIPQYLAAKPTDTEAQKNSKKRRVKAIKQQQKTEQAEQQLADSAKLWQQFNKKASKKTMPGFMTGRGHESIFRGIEVKPNINPVEANRQLQQQQTFQPRRKHDFDEGNLPDE
ncbi:hypothetical protein, conserved [Eimeria tenella]|uniref:Tudor domain-containing protein n=1 Tax=Eimeria tenella TaxID=5802 RepID=U6KTN7_EIMTE|nr:hypothetical protein, conserved [Eimeria tenella]CDJ39744.1 hypothetical protein, conserved [Eimeria tenella]|eukprot:XP_013230497.1 hypothetical protein, conserved [Eimeria tenella]